MLNKIQINEADINELILLPNVTLNQVEDIVRKRKSGVIFKNIDDINDLICWCPHELIRAEEMISFQIKKDNEHIRRVEF